MSDPGVTLLAVIAFTLTAVVVAAATRAALRSRSRGRRSIEGWHAA